MAQTHIMTEFSPHITTRKRVNWLYLQAGDGVQYVIKADQFQTGRQSEAIEFFPQVFGQSDATLVGASYLARANGLTVSIEEKFPSLTVSALNLLTPSMDYISSSITVIYPTGFVKDADNTEPSVAGHYSRRKDGRVLVLTGAGDKYLILKYDIKTGGHTARVVVEGVRRVFESDGPPIPNIAIATDKWRGYKLPIMSVTYTVTENHLRAELDLGEDLPRLGRLHEAILIRLGELRQGL